MDSDYQLKQEETVLVSDVFKYISTNTVFFSTDNNIINNWLLTPDQRVRFEKTTLPAHWGGNIRCFNPNMYRHGQFIRTLYDLTIAPLINQFKGDELVIIPCDSLCLAPWNFADPDSKYRRSTFLHREAYVRMLTIHIVEKCNGILF